MLAERIKEYHDIDLTPYKEDLHLSKLNDGRYFESEYDRLFVDWMKDLGYDRYVALEPIQETMNKMVTITTGNHSMDVNQFVTIWPNKDSYLYAAMLDEMKMSSDVNQIKWNLRCLMDDIKYDEQSRVCELGWQWRTPKHQSEYSPQGRLKLLFKFFKYAKEDIESGHWGHGVGQDGDTIVVYPYGDKDYKTWTNESRELGTKQRQSMAKRFGFGALSEEGCMYSTYSEGKMHPW